MPTASAASRWPWCSACRPARKTSVRYGAAVQPQPDDRRRERLQADTQVSEPEIDQEQLRERRHALKIST